MNQSDKFKEHQLMLPSFVILFLQTIQSGLFINPYDAIYKQVQFAYDLGKDKLLFTNKCTFLGYLIMLPFIGRILNVNGLTKSNILAQAFFLIGAILRMGILQSLTIAYFGQIFFGMGISLLLSSQMRFVYNWIEPQKRPKFIVFLSVAFLIGQSLGRFYPLALIDDSVKDIKIAQDNINLFNLTFIMITGIFLMIINFFFRGSPPQSHGWYQSKDDNNLSFFPYFKQIFRSRTFQIYLIMYCIMMIFNYSMLYALPVILKESGYSEQADMICFTIGIFSGVIGSTIYIYKNIKKNNSYYLPKFLALGILFYCLFCLNIVFLYKEWVLYIFYGGFSFFIMVVQPLIFELSIRILPQESLNLVNSIYFTTGVFAGVIGMIIKDFLFDIFENKRDSNFEVELFFLTLLILLLLLSYKID